MEVRYIEYNFSISFIDNFNVALPKLLPVFFKIWSCISSRTVIFLITKYFSFLKITVEVYFKALIVF